MVSTGDAFNAFVFLEVSSIGTYALIAIGEKRDRRALPAAFNYLIMGTIGATFYVVGVGFLFAATGTLNMADMGARLATLGDSSVVQAGFAFIVVGLGIKAAMFPLHGWLPGAYSYAPSLIAIFLAATATKASIYLMARFVFDVFPDGAAFGHGWQACQGRHLARHSARRTRYGFVVRARVVDPFSCTRCRATRRIRS